MTSAPVAYLWVPRSDYADFRAACSDGDSLPADYETFIQDLNKLGEDFRTNGVIAVKVNIKTSDFVEWCVANGVAINTEAGSFYASFRYTQFNKKS